MSTWFSFSLQEGVDPVDRGPAGSEGSDIGESEFFNRLAEGDFPAQVQPRDQVCRGWLRPEGCRSE